MIAITEIYFLYEETESYTHTQVFIFIQKHILLKYFMITLHS